MPNPNAVVANVLRVEPPPEAGDRRERTVVLEGERQARLDPGNPRSAGFAQILDGVRKMGTPVYVELDPATSAITRILIPDVTRVIGLRESNDGLLVDVQFSHALHLLRRGAEDYNQLEAALRESLRTGDLVTMTESDEHEILDVRAYKPGPEGPPVPFPKIGPPGKIPPARPWYEVLQIWRWLCWILWWWCCISPTRAQQVFDAMAATTCDPLTVPAPCIPFLYPDDGCWARAHEMRRLMVNMGLSPNKVWIQGTLHVNTRNNPQCFVNWGWHVAPTLCVRGPGWFQTQDMVIDPSLFTTPVDEPTWKGVQGDPSATLTPSDGSIYYYWGYETDPTYSKTNFQLNKYRLKLQARAVQYGPPPYANCP
jgi:hypothetical protein